jgi:D-methionine transport system substrate-binding protein
MKRRSYFPAIIVILSVVIGGIRGQSSEIRGQSPKKLVIGASPVPHTEILEQIKPFLAKKGINLEIKVLTDYVIPNLPLAGGSLDANFFQHQPYLESFAKDKHLSLSPVGAVHFEPLGIYSKKIKSLKALKAGDKIAVPNDTTNEARALILLRDNGILKLKDPKNLKSTKADIASYAKKIEIVEIEAAQLTRSLDSVTAAIINGNYAIDAKLDPSTDAIAVESAKSVSAKTYANIVVVRKGDENRPEIKALVEALRSPAIRKFILDRYKGAVVPAE